MPALAAREAAKAERRRKRREREGGGVGGGAGKEQNDCDESDDDANDDPLPPLPCIVAVDLQPMAPVEGVTQLQGDITSAATAAAVIETMKGRGGSDGGGKRGKGDDDDGDKKSSSSSRAQLVVCDGAPDVTGLHDMDEFVQSQLVVAALTVATELLEEGGTLVAKVFRGREAPALLAQLEPFFRGEPLSSSSSSPSSPTSSSSSPYGGGVFLAKPRASRNASVEAFVVCRGYMHPSRSLFGFAPRDLGGAGGGKGGRGLWPALAGAASVGLDAADADGDGDGDDRSDGPGRSGKNKSKLVPFVACGDLRGWDADRSYDLPAAPVGRKKNKKGGGGGGDKGDGDNSSDDEEEPNFYVPLPPTALPTAPAYAGALAASGRPAAGMRGTGA